MVFSSIDTGDILGRALGFHLYLPLTLLTHSLTLPQSLDSTSDNDERDERSRPLHAAAARRGVLLFQRPAGVHEPLGRTKTVQPATTEQPRVDGAECGDDRLLHRRKARGCACASPLPRRERPQGAQDGAGLVLLHEDEELPRHAPGPQEWCQVRPLLWRRCCRFRRRGGRGGVASREAGAADTAESQPGQVLLAQGAGACCGRSGGRWIVGCYRGTCLPSTEPAPDPGRRDLDSDGRTHVRPAARAGRPVPGGQVQASCQGGSGRGCRGRSGRRAQRRRGATAHADSCSGTGRIGRTRHSGPAASTGAGEQVVVVEVMHLTS